MPENVSCQPIFISAANNYRKDDELDNKQFKADKTSKFVLFMLIVLLLNK
jgi:hypothetical protein